MSTTLVGPIAEKAKRVELLTKHIEEKAANQSWLSEILHRENEEKKWSGLFPYAVCKRGVGKVKKEGSSLPQKQPTHSPEGKERKPLFLLNIPMGVSPGSTQIKERVDKLLKTLKDQSYSSKASLSCEQVVNKLAVVIGVNQIESIDAALNHTFKETILTIDTSKTKFSHRVQGFLWVPEWEQKVDSKKIYPKEKAFTVLKCLTPNRAKIIREQLEGKGTIHIDLRAQIPYQKIREHIKNSACNLKLVEDIQKKAKFKAFYFVTMDDDIQGLRSQKLGYFSHLEEEIAQIYKKNLIGPHIISLGYQLSDEALPIPRLAVQCDMAVRTAMNQIIPGSVYMPEPGTAYQLSIADLKRFSFCTKKNEKALESRRAIQNGLNKGLFEKKHIHFIGSKALLTSMPARMKTANATKYATLTPADLRKKEVLKALRGISQVHFSPLDWAHAVFEALPDNLKKGDRGICQKLSGILSRVFVSFDFIHMATELIDTKACFSIYEEAIKAIYAAQKEDKVKCSRGLPVMQIPKGLERYKIALQSQFSLLLNAKKDLVMLKASPSDIEKIIECAFVSAKALFKELSKH
jgi:hypothetical protein